MGTLSRETFDRVTKGATCHDFMHPWAIKCSDGIFEMFKSGVKGSFKFAFFLNLVQLLSKGKNMTKHHIIFNIDQTLRMVALGSGNGVIFIASACLLSNLLGRYHYYLSLTIPGFLGGSSIFLMRKVKRHFIISAFSGALLETLLHVYTPLGNPFRYRKTKTLLFMLVNGAFLYIVRQWKTHKLDQTAPEIWFYSPGGVSEKSQEETQKSKHRPCNHSHSCVRSILKETSNYFLFGTVVEILRITLPNFKTIVKNPKLGKFIFKKSTLRLAAFAGVYVFLYKVTNCLLCRMSGKDSAFNGLVSGFVSGLSYYIYPSSSLTTTAFTNLIHIIWRYFNLNEKLFGNFPTSEILFMFVCAFLFHYRMVAPNGVSKFFVNTIGMATNGRSEQMYHSFAKLI